MTSNDRYEARVTPAAWRSLWRLPPRVHAGIIEFATRRLTTDPHRIGYRLHAPFTDQLAAPYGVDYRVRYEVDEDKHAVVILRFDHRTSTHNR